MVVDKTSGIVINTDMGAYSAIKKAREEKRRQATLLDRVDALEKRVLELEGLLNK